MKEDSSGLETDSNEPKPATHLSYGEREVEVALGEAVPFLGELSPHLIHQVAMQVGTKGDALIGTAVSSLSPNQIELIAKYLANHWEMFSSRTLGDLLPPLKSLNGVKVEAEDIPVRLYNLLYRKGKSEWTQICELTLADVWQWRNSGRLTVSAMFRHAIRQCLLLLSVDSFLSPALASDDFSGTLSPIEGNLRIQQQLTSGVLRDSIAEIAAWGWTERGVASLQDAIREVTVAEELPKEVQDSWSRLAALDLWVLSEGRRSKYDLSHATELLKADLDDRTQGVLLQRPFNLKRNVTLVELGKQLGVTRERVRQMEEKALDGISKRIQETGLDVISRAARRLSHEIGTAMPVDSLPCPVPESLDLDDPERFRWGLLLWLGGPYTRVDDWVLKTSGRDLVNETQHRISELMQEGIVEEDAAVDAMEELGILSEFRKPWLRRLFREEGGYLMARSASLAHRAEVVLKKRLVPMTKEEIAEALGAETNIRTLGNYLLSDERFVRTGLNHYGLRDWDLEEYTSIVDEISQEIERNGGEATLEHLINTLTTAFGVSESSVRAYASSAHFVRTNRGTLRVASAEHSQELKRKRPIQLTRRCVRSPVGWGIRLTVTTETLRGSGTSISPAIGQYLGLRFGDSAIFESEFGDIKASWVSLSVTLSSVRTHVEALEGEVGDLLFIFFGEERANLRLVDRSVIEGAKGLERLALELGVTDAGSDSLISIAEAIGLEPHSSVEEVRQRLLMRGEEDLAALLPHSWEQDEAASIERLAGVLGRITRPSGRLESDDYAAP